MNRTGNTFLMAAVLLSGSVMAQGTPGLVSERSISASAAMELANTSLERCRADGYKVTITVLNRHARTAVVISDDGVNPHTLRSRMRRLSVSWEKFRDGR